jgi:hypothetical protein
MIISTDAEKKINIVQYLFLIQKKKSSIIPATQEAKIRRIMAQGQTRQNIRETPSQPTSWVFWCIPVTPAT